MKLLRRSFLAGLFSVVAVSSATAYWQSREQVSAGAAAVNITLTDSSVDATDQTTYTFASQSFGATAADRKIVVGVGARGSGNFTISSVTIGGVTATLVVNSSSGLQDQAALYIADVPTGTTGSVVIVLSTGILRCGIGVWRMIGAASSTPTDTGISAADPATTTLTISANGSGVGYGIQIDATSTATWTGLNEDFDEVIEATITQSGASLNSGAGGDISVSLDWSGAPTLRQAAFASWAP